MESERVQIVKYACCKKTFAACMEPECYTDKDWLKSLKKYVNRGDEVDLVERGDFKFEKCECKKFTAAIENSIPIPANQLSLFENV